MFQLFLNFQGLKDKPEESSFQLMAASVNYDCGNLFLLCKFAQNDVHCNLDILSSAFFLSFLHFSSFHLILLHFLFFQHCYCKSYFEQPTKILGKNLISMKTNNQLRQQRN